MNYQKEYDNLISYRKTTVLEKSNDLYTETHHIIPKCLGGTDNEDNLVELTGEEHYRAHYYLYHCYEIGSKEYTKAINAFNIMNKDGKNRGRYYDPKLYQELREDRRNNFKIINLNSLKEICEWIDINGELCSSSKDKLERKRYRLVKRLIEYRNSNNHLWYDEYQELVEELGNKDLFKDLYQVTIDNINELCDFINENNRNPISHKEDYLFSKLSNLRRRKRVNKTWNKDFDNLLKERNCLHIFFIIYYIKYMKTISFF